MKKYIFLFLTAFAFNAYSQSLSDKLPGQAELAKYRSNLLGLDSLMQKAIVTDSATGLQFYTPAALYKGDYDWDSYFQAIVQIYMGWSSKYIKEGILLFLENENESGFIPRSVPADPWDAKEQVKPFMAQICYLVFEAYGEKDWILKEPYFSQLKKYLDYWLNQMTNKNDGLSFWMSAPHTGMDDQVERAGYWEDAQCEGVDLNCYLVRETLAFSKLAHLAGKEDMAEKYEKISEDRRQAIRKLLWDDKDGFFYDRKVHPEKPLSKTAWVYSPLNSLSAGQYKIPVKSVESFAVLWSKVATPEQARRMIVEHLFNPREFWTPYPVSALAKSEPWYSTTEHPADMGCNWRANVWMPTNYMVYHGLKNYGYNDLASILAQRTKELLDKSGNREYFSSETGEGLGCDPFWGWTLIGHFFDLEENLKWDINNIK
jgi:hypothetical protein